MFQFTPLILCALGGVTAGVFLLCIVIDKVITKERIREAVKNESLSMPNAFKYKIKEAKKNAVNVGIFDCNGQELKEIKIESSKGLSPTIKINTWEYC